MQPDLLSLAARVEELTGPDREVDAEVMFDLCAAPVGQHKEDGGPTGYIWPGNDPSWNLGLRFPGKDRAWFGATRKKIKGETLLIERDGAYVLMNSHRVPPVTVSVDAVLVLIERELPGTRLMMSAGDDFSSAMITAGWGHRKRTLCPQIERPDNHVAICAVAAFLRAKAAQQQMEADRP